MLQSNSAFSLPFCVCVCMCVYHFHIRAGAGAAPLLRGIPTHVGRALEHYRIVNSVLYFAYVYPDTFTSAQVLELLHFSEGYRRAWSVH